VPGFWRNVCPMAALNQVPRLFGFTRGLVLPQWLKEYGYVVGIALFLAIVPTRKVLFNQDGTALGLLMLVALGSAFVGGLIFKGKSGWCGSICPLLPVQRVYGQTPFVTVRNGHCAPCVGCTKNCYDFNPTAAYLADLHDEDPHYRHYRTFFVSAFPGLVLAFYLVPSPPEISVLDMYLLMGGIVLGSVGSFALLESFLKVTTNRLTGLYGAVALNSYYWFAFPVLAGSIGTLVGEPLPEWIVWAARVALLGPSALWLARTYAKEPLFLLHSATAEPTRVSAAGVAALRRATRVDHPEVTVLPDNKRIAATSGSTLLEVIEANGLSIESGCRMGMCGADPVAICDGMENLEY
jgi:nitrite reductase (NADH) large subunit